MGEFKRMGAVCKPQENSFLLRRLYSANFPEKKLQFMAMIKREILTSREVLYLDEVCTRNQYGFALHFNNKVQISRAL